MNEPRYPEDVFKTIWLWIGIAFIAMGLLNFIIVFMSAVESAGQEPNINGVIILVIGAMFLIAQSVLRGIASRKKKLHNELLANGNRINGTVEKVCVEMGVRYAGKTPYIVYLYLSPSGKGISSGELFFMG